MATYAIPPTMTPSGGHFGHSHSRNSPVQRSPLGSASINGGYQLNGAPALNEFLKPEMLPQHTHHKSADIFLETRQEKTLPSLQLPSAHSSFSSPLNDRAKSTERRKSLRLPTHLHLEGSEKGYGFPAPSTNQRFRAPSILPGESVKSITTAEAVSSVLVPLPYVLASLAYRSLLSYRSKDYDLSRIMPSSLQAKHEWPLVCSLTSITLIFVGARGKIWAPAESLDRRKRSLGVIEDVEKFRWVHKSRRIVGRILTVGLPFYATSQLGAARVGLIMLIGLASNIITIDYEAADLTRAKGWATLLSHRRWTLGSTLIQLVCDLTGLINHSGSLDVLMGYLALSLSILILPPPFPSSRPKLSVVASSAPASEAEVSAVLATPRETPPRVESGAPKMHVISPIIATQEDVNLTLWSGFALGVFGLVIILLFNPGSKAFSLSQVSWNILTGFAAALGLTMAEPKSLQSNKGLGLVIGSLMASLLLALLGGDLWSSFAYQSALVGISFVALNRDTSIASSSVRGSTYSHHHNPAKAHSVEHENMSRFSALLIRSVPPWPLLHSILLDKDSRRIFYFMCLNFGFMLVQTFYGLVTGSLGLLSDSIHMFFDCLALVVGLCAAVMSKWPPSTRFPYGYGKMDTLAGFANGIFLMLISIEIVYEAIERLAEGDRINRLGELLTVSALGLLVNIVGLTAFGHAHHGHGHDHGGHDHEGHSHTSHDHVSEQSHHDHSRQGLYHQDNKHHNHEHPHIDHGRFPSERDHSSDDVQNQNHLHSHLSTGPSPSPSVYSSFPATPSKPVHPHTHSYGHDTHNHKHHDHSNENMYGIYLHVLADTLGSVAVVISTVLIHYTKWSGFDPLASCVIAVLIFASAIPLVTSSARKLLLTVPDNTEYDLREALAGLSGLRGVVGYAVPKFWLEEGENAKVLGVIHVIAGGAVGAADLDDIKERVISFLNGRNLDVVVQVEREGNGRCWCQATK